MSSEEKEPYFDGPLVTPSTGQVMFYPGQNHMEVARGDQLMPGVHLNPVLPQAVPALYNPNDFNANAQAYAWNPLPPMPDRPPHSRMNGTQAVGENQGLQGAQAYFGGAESGSSAASSQHTSPQHGHHQKITEPQAYNAQPNMTIDSGNELPLDGLHQSPGPPDDRPYSGRPMPSANDHTENDITHGPPAIDAEEEPMASNQAAAGYATEDLQNYMNSGPNELNQYAQQFENETEEIDSLELPEKPLTATPEPKDQNSLNPVDLHNTSLTDQSYMNMAYNHNYSNVIPRPLQNVGNYVGAGFNVEPLPMLIPATSSQDYDILHSQGTWNAYGRNLLSDYNQSSFGGVPPSTVAQDVEGLGGDMNSLSVEENPTAAHSNSEMPSDEPAEDLPASVDTYKDKDGEIGDAGQGALSGVEAGFLTNTSTGDGSQQIDPVPVPEFVPHSYHQDRAPMPELTYTQPTPEKTVDSAPDYELGSMANANNNERFSGYDPEQNSSTTTANTDLVVTSTSVGHLGPALYENPTVLAPGSNMGQDREIQHGAMDLSMLATNATAAQSNVQSHASGDGTRQWSTGPYESIPPDSASNKEELSHLTKALHVDPASSGLHPQAVDRNPHSSEPHQNLSLFVSPTSAFESRIRSPSTSSNNSTTSSHKSAGSQSKSAQNRQAHQASHAPVTSEVNETNSQSSLQPANPFSTNTMHSSHVDDPQQFMQPRTNNRPEQREDPAPPPVMYSAPVELQDENLRTSAPVPSNNPQSLHSQVLPHGTIYTPEQPPAASVTVAYSERSQLQEPHAVASSAGVVPHRAPEVGQNVASLKFQDRTENPGRGNDASLPPLPANVSSDPYLSRSINSTTSLPNDPVPPPVSSTATYRQHESDLRRLPIDDRQEAPRRSPSRDFSPRRDRSPVQEHPPRPRYADAEGSFPGVEGSPRHKYSHQQREPHEYGPRDGFRDTRDNFQDRGYDQRDPRRQGSQTRPDDVHARGREWDYRDDPYRTGFDSHRPVSQQGQEARPRSRQEEDSSHYPRHYGERDYGRDPYYDRHGRHDRYYDNRYPQDYNRRDPYYSSYDHRGYEQHYDPYQRYPDQWHGRSHQYYDNYYYGGYYGDQQRQYGSRRPDDEDAASVYSERSHATERDPAFEQSYQARRRSYAEPTAYAADYGYGYEYDPRYYDGSLNDESTLSNTYDESWQRLPQVPARQTPVKFSTTHTIVRFGPGGQLIKVLSNRPADNQPSTVEIHSLEILLQDTPEAEDLRSYAGPLSKDQTHKNDVLQFCNARSDESMKDASLLDRRSTSLIWDFLAMLVRQNGSVHGTDIAELLTKDHTGDFGFLQSPLEAARLQLQQQQQQRVSTPNSIADDHTGTSTPLTNPAETSAATLTEKNCGRFRELLLHGRKKDALEWAMKCGLWGHALLLASKTDSRTHAQVMLRFANSLPINDPLQTVYQLMSGRQPAAATCVSEEGWGDWRPHLAMILSNPTSSASLDMRAVLTMGDTLSSRGLLHAAHFCYLMSSTPLGYYGRTTSKMVLLGGNHTLPFVEFSSWDSIRRTEIYEYAISLGKSQRSGGSSTREASLPPLQLYKFIYACKLAEYGLISQAFHYCERVAKSVCRSPAFYSATLVSQLLEIADRLRYHDPQIHVGIAEPGGLRWLELLRNVNAQIQSGMIVPRSQEPPSLLTASNAPSVISTTSTSASPNDEIRFSAHTPDQDEDEDDGNMDAVDGGQQRSPGYETTQYPSGKGGPPLTAYSGGGGQGYEPGPPMIMVPGISQQQAPVSYGQDPHVSQAGGMQNNYPQQQFMQPQSSFYQQTGGELQDFGSLASQANPLASAGFSAPQQSSFAYDHNQQNRQPAADEEAERNDQVDFYDYMSSTRKQHVHASSRSRTVSQSSQRSRASTLKGYDRASPTSMVSNHTEQGQRSRKTSENSAGKRSRKTSGEQHHHHREKLEDDKTNTVKKSGSWSLFGWLSRRRPNQVHLPDDNNKDIYWDNEKKQWVDKNATEEESAPPPPPPVDDVAMPPAMNTMPGQQPHGGQSGATQFQAQPLEATPGNSQPLDTLTPNRFSLKNLGGNRSMYKNAFESSSKPAPVAAAPSLLPGMQFPAVPNPTGFLIPNAAAASTPSDSAPIATSTPMHHAGDAQSIQMFTPGNTPHGSANDFRQPFNHQGSVNSLQELSVVSDHTEVVPLHTHSRSSSLSSAANEVRSLMAVDEESAATSAPPMPPGQATAGAPQAVPTMFYNPSQFGAGPNLLTQPAMPVGQGSSFGKGRGQPSYGARR